jgi:hypothetical protein
MAWYYNAFYDNTAHEEYKVLAWRWTPDNALNFYKWAKEHGIKYKCEQGEIFDKKFDQITFYNHWADIQDNENFTFKIFDKNSFIIYLPWIDKNNCFPFDIENLEDFHKEYIWHEEKNNEY